MISLLRTEATNPDFVKLVKYLDADLAERDGEETAFYSQYNGIAQLPFVVVLYENEQALGCGAMKPFGEKSLEVKRMYTDPDSRGKGIASQVLAELERWAAEAGYQRCVLETGKRQPEAIALYEKNGYAQISNFAPYVGVENSVCFEKHLLPVQP